MFHGVSPFGFAPGIGTNKKPPIDQKRRSMCEPWRFLLFGSFDPLIAWVFQASHRGSFSNSSVGTLRLLKVVGIPDVCSKSSTIVGIDNRDLCHRKNSNNGRSPFSSMINQEISGRSIKIGRYAGKQFFCCKKSFRRPSKRRDTSRNMDGLKADF